MLVPVMQSTGTRSSSRTFRTPTWAAPRAPPPERTRQMRGRACAAVQTARDANSRSSAPRRTAPGPCRSEAEIDADGVAVDADLVVLHPLREHAPRAVEVPASADAVDELALRVLHVRGLDRQLRVAVRLELRTRVPQAAIQVEVLDRQDAHEAQAIRLGLGL